MQGLGDDGAEQLVEPVDDADYGFDELCPFFPGQRVVHRPRYGVERRGRTARGRRKAEDVDPVW